MNDDSSLSHTRWNCKCHIVFVPKYRRKVIYGKLRKDIGTIISINVKIKVPNCVHVRIPNSYQHK